LNLQSNSDQFTANESTIENTHDFYAFASLVDCIFSSYVHFRYHHPHSSDYHEITKEYPSILTKYITYQSHRSSTFHYISTHSRSDLQVQDALKALSLRLADNPFFNGKQPCFLDYYVFSLLYLVLNIPNSKLTEFCHQYDNLIQVLIYF
jgi:hypothetical protein